MYIQQEDTVVPCFKYSTFLNSNIQYILVFSTSLCCKNLFLAVASLFVVVSVVAVLLLVFPVAAF